jgi:hypothetical protein
MNIRKRIERLKLIGGKLAEEEVQLEKDAIKAGFTIEEYEQLKGKIARLLRDELIKLAAMSPVAEIGSAQV